MGYMIPGPASRSHWFGRRDTNLSRERPLKVGKPDAALTSQPDVYPPFTFSQGNLPRVAR
jgi:hypothetical protein